MRELLTRKRGLVVGIANAHSIARGCAEVFSQQGADLAVTYLNDKAKPHVEEAIQDLRVPIFMPLDVEKQDELESVFSRIEREWGGLDFLLHSIAYCPQQDLHGRVVDCSAEGFARAMDVSVHSLIRMARLAEPLMENGGCILTVSYYGAERVVDHYNVMGPVKAALETTVKYLAAELGPQGIRVNALSPGPLKTRAASGIDHFDQLIDDARNRAPEHRLVTIEEIGNMAAGLASDAARSVTGNIAFVDAGHHVMS